MAWKEPGERIAAALGRTLGATAAQAGSGGFVCALNAERPDQ